jgi:hypothetical protein
MPYHLELGSEGNSFHGKAIVVNTKTGEHKSLHPIPLENAKAQMRILEDVAEKEDAPKPRRVIKVKKVKKVKEEMTAEMKEAITYRALDTLWEGSPTSHNGITYKPDSDITDEEMKSAINKAYIGGTDIHFDFTGEGGSVVITPHARNYQSERSFQTQFNKKAWIQHHVSPEGYQYTSAQIEEFHPGRGFKKEVKAEPEAKKVHIPKIDALPSQMKKGMRDKLSGMEDTHEYTLGMGHPTKYILDWIEKFKQQEKYWGKDYSTALKFFQDVAKYVNEMTHDATSDGKPQKIILLKDWEKIF